MNLIVVFLDVIDAIHQEGTGPPRGSMVWNGEYRKVPIRAEHLGSLLKTSLRVKMICQEIN